MKTITFYYDPISPYAYLAFEALPKALLGLSYAVAYKPVFLGAILVSHGQLAPAEIAPKRDWTYRQVLWQAKQLCIQFQMPAMHPFMPLPLLRLAAAASDEQGFTNRFVTGQIFNHVWQGGLDANDAERLAALTERLAHKITAGVNSTSDAAKTRLKTNTDDAIKDGCFGVPSFVVGEGLDKKVFWGLDSLPMLREYLEGNAWFDSNAGWDSVAKIGVGFKRP